LSTANKTQTIFTNYLPGTSTEILEISVTAKTNRRLSGREKLITDIVIVISLIVGAFITRRCALKKALRDPKNAAI